MPRAVLVALWLVAGLVLRLALDWWERRRAIRRRRVASVWPEKVGATWTEEVRRMPLRTRADDHAPWPGLVRPPEALAVQFPRLTGRQLAAVARRRLQEHPA
jgi:hypothetical protein